MEAIITVVGFLGSGKTTLLRHLVNEYIKRDWNPFVILNDYENAHLDIQQFVEKMDKKYVWPLSGSCICCSGINELREYVNGVPDRERGVTLIEANGTSDACSLMGFLGVGINERFLPPVQISCVDVKNWQKWGEHNELEANQVQVSSLMVLTHTENVSSERKEKVMDHLKELNPYAKIISFEELDVTLLPGLTQSENTPQKLEHHKAHWASCSTDLPALRNEADIERINVAIPNSVLRVKGVTQLEGDTGYTYFERTPDGKLRIRPFNGVPTVGTKLLVVGPGSSPEMLEHAIATGVEA